MSQRHSFLVVLGFLTLGAAAASAAQVPVIDPAFARQVFLAPPGLSRVIVEFHGTPRALLAGEASAALHQEIFARFRRDLVLAEDARAAGKRGGAEPSQIRYEYSDLFFGAAVSVPSDQVDRLRQLPYVRAVHPDTEVRAYSTGSVVDARAGVNAQGLAARGSGIVVAIIDTGIDYTHPALGGGFGPGFKVAGGWDFSNDDADPMDDHGHGTHVAGTVAANAAGLIGVAPDATLIAYKVLGAAGNGEISGIIAAIDRSADPNGDGNPADRVHVINMSLGGPGTADDAASRAVDNATAAGIVVCVAAGNDGATASIGSPGTAVSAMTVGAIDAAGVIAPFSSRGPSPRLLGFKPDLTAPGVGIVSSIPGGGTLALNGTSMATPHVAGVAALLRQLHPSWSPQEIKASLIAGAVESVDPALARGAGRVDAARAHAAPVLADAGSVMFGLQGSKSGTWEATRSITLRNRSSVAQSLSVTAKGSVDGISVTMNPAALTLAPGQAKRVDVTIRGDNARHTFPVDGLAGGDLRFTGSTSFSIPWGMLRAARAVLISDFRANYIPLSSSRSSLFRYGANEAELIMPPGPVTLLAFSEGRNDGEERSSLTIMALENYELEGDTSVTLHAADAVHEVLLDGRAPDGSPLPDLPVERGTRDYFLDLRLMARGDSFVFDLGIGGYNAIHAVRTNTLSTTFTLLARESYIDLETMKAYHHESVPLKGISSSITLAPSSQYRMARLAWNLRVRSPFKVCNQTAFEVGSLSAIGSFVCLSKTVDRGTNTFELWSTDEPSTESFSGLQFTAGRLISQTFRATADGFVSSDEMIPPITAHRIPEGATASIGNGVAYPFFYVGTGVVQFLWPFWGFRGAMGELYTDFGSVDWRVFDSSGAVRSEGRFGEDSNQLPPAAVPGSRFVATRPTLGGGDYSARGTIEAKFASGGEDLAAPAFTSFMITAASGAPTSRLAAGEAGRLSFSAADFAATGFFRSQLSRPEATRAWYRVHGTPDWLPLSVVVTGSETGERRVLKHYPAGDVYSVDLSPASVRADVAVDLKIDLEDVAGNKLTWIQEPAFRVGDPPADPPRQRVVGRN